MRLPGPLHVVNEGLAFLIEMAAFAVLAWWGFTVGDSILINIVVGLAAPAAAITLWGLFAAPKARFKVGLPIVLLVKTAVFAAAALAVLGVGHPVLALVFAAIALVNTALATLDRDARFRTARDEPASG
ncbi:YrdB family protein [Actinomadura algeriensis]|uniref:Zn-dependent protease n=1 Tax=Actinomadura algeriensis TaxID=1679523 RepID=A0ABR9JP28_9ACTN|nr:YrdB family protein [Actinomadura algeriensis]MBE1532326.1 Zn-dependent protease [Actinomadura algeriensis]